MPFYDFQCQKDSEHIFEELVNRDEPNPPCIECGSETSKMPSLVAKGVVELSPSEISSKIAQERKSLNRELLSDEKKYANVMGESKYERSLKNDSLFNQEIDKIAGSAPKIKKSEKIL